MKKVKSFTKFNEEREYDFSHSDVPDIWSVHVPDDRPQQYDKVICIDNVGDEDKLTINKVYQILGFSSMGDMYWIDDDTKRYNYYPIKHFSDTTVNEGKAKTPDYSPRKHNTQADPEILEHIEDYNERRGHFENDYSGYLIQTNKRTIKIIILSEQNCCEDWGYFMSEDNFQDFYGAEIKSVEVVDDALNSVELRLDHIEEQHDDDRGTQTMFVNFQTSEGLLQFVAYNNHNGYYGHTALFIIDDNIEAEKKL